MLWIEERLEWWRWLIPSWHMVLESAKDRILGGDTTGQHVPPHVWYEMTCLLIRNTIGCMSCSVEWGLTSYFVTYIVIRLNHMVQEGTFFLGNLSTASGAVCLENRSKG
jgi:hypothetical protein